jgi:hypothetical protein
MSWIRFFDALFEKDRQGANIKDFKYRENTEKVKNVEAMQIIDQRRINMEI